MQLPKQFRSLPWRDYRYALPVLAITLLAAATAWYWYDAARDAELARQRSLPPVDPVALIPPFKSHSGVAEATVHLAEEQLTFTTDSIDLPAIGDSPAKHIDSIEVGDYRHLGISGRLTLHFFQDRLYETVFEPEDTAGYARAAQRQLGLRPDPRLNARSEVVQGKRRIATNVHNANSRVGRSAGTRPYILWQDLPLLEARQR